MGRRRGETGRKRPAPSEAKKARALPLVVEGRSQSEIAREVGVSRSTVRRWMDTDPAFSEAVEQAHAAAREAVSSATDRIGDLVTASLEALESLVRSEDERVRLDAAKTALDRFGHPVMARAETTTTHEAGASLRIVMEPGDARRLAAEED